MTVELKKLEEEARALGRVIKDAVLEDIGFVVVLSDFGPGGHMTYLSNGTRESMVELLRELVANIEQGNMEGSTA
jgi:hypothetical protein